MGRRPDEPSVLTWRRRAIAEGDERGIGLTDELLRGVSAAEAERLSVWVTDRLKRLARRRHALELGSSICLLLVGGLIARRITKSEVAFTLTEVGGTMVAAYVVKRWFARSPRAAELRFLLESLVLVPWPAARTTPFGCGYPECLAALLRECPEVAHLMREDLMADSAHPIENRVMVAWLRHIKERFNTVATGEGIPLAEVVFAMAGRHAYSSHVRRLVRGLARKEGHGPAQREIVHWAKESLAQIEARSPSRLSPKPAD